MGKKPIFYEAACIFSIIGSCIGIISMLIPTLFFRFSIEKITQFTNITATEKLSPTYFALLTILFCISLTGAIKLYKMQRTGIFIYLCAQLFILLIPVVWLGSNAFSMTNAVFTSIFSVIYIFNYRITK